MAKDLTLEHHRGAPSEAGEILKKPISQEMLDRDLARLAYVAKDGTPRVVPIAFTWNGTEVVMCTSTNAPKLASLRRNPAVALTIDTEVHPPKILLLRGEVVLAEVDGIPDEYHQMNGTYETTAEQQAEWEIEVRALAERCQLLGLGENVRVIIRPAGTADASAIASILGALVSTTTIDWTDTPHTAEGVLAWLDEHETVLVAEDHGDVVGVAAFGWFRDAQQRPGYRFTVENTIHVREDRWRTGVGRELLGALVEVARASGKHAMVAAVDGANEASIRFHERFGFVEVARMPEVGAKFGRWLDLVLLQLRLDDRPAPGRG
jgi:L-amino acid N-acyltransferase YncA